MALTTEPCVGTWTAVDLVARFGPIPLHRIRLDPPPGTASEEDVVRIHDHEDRLFELVDGVLVEKAMGTYESYLAMESKLAEYFAAGVRLVWYVYPIPREVKVYSTRDQCVVVGEEQTLTGGEVLPRFSLSLREFFAEPGPDATP